eukprot:3818777-Pleurochrysis_carterae.AAC.1
MLAAAEHVRYALPLPVVQNLAVDAMRVAGFSCQRLCSGVVFWCAEGVGVCCRCGQQGELLKEVLEIQEFSRVVELSENGVPTPKVA